MTEAVTRGKSRAGDSLRRVEDDRLITGKGKFTDNRASAGELHVHLVRSYVAHARVASLDLEAARQSPGVVAVYTAADLAADGVNPFPAVKGFTRPDGEPMVHPDRHAIAGDVVRHVGEIVAAVVAETQAQAADGASLVEVDYDELPVTGSLEQAVEANTPAIWEGCPSNAVAYKEFGDAEAVAQAFAQAAHVSKLDLRNNRLVGNALEPRTVLCEYDAETGRRTLRLGSQNVHGLLGGLSATLGVPKETLRVIVEDVGGAFGIKSGLYPEDVIVAYAAAKLKRSIRWRGTRSEEFVATVHGRDQISHAELACAADGRVLGLRIETQGSVGAYPTGAGLAIPLMIGPKVATSLYHVPAFHLQATAYASNTAPLGAYRGAGRPESIYLMERLMDQAAREMGIDPVEMRHRNFIAADAFPYTTPMKEVYDSGKFGEVLDRCIEVSDWNGFAARQAQSQATGKLRGRGLSCYIEWTGAEWKEEVRLEATPQGLTCYSGTQAMGQGIITTYLQLLSESLDLPLEQLQVLQGDTDRVQGMGSYASRSLYIGGSAVKEGAEVFLEEARKLAAEALEAAPEDLIYQDGRFTVTGTDIGVGLLELAEQQPDQTISTTSSTRIPVPSWPNGAQVAEVEVDPETGKIQLQSLVAVDDVGNAINPMIIAGQVHGGMAQALGQALLEDAVYDESGQFVNSTFLDYALPRADDLPSLQTELHPGVPCETNPLGAKGVGELGTVGATPAIVNAVLDALREQGVTHLEMPLTPQRVWAALNH